MEYLVALLLAAEIVYFVLGAARLRKDGKTGGPAAWAAGLCAGADLAFLLPRLLLAWFPTLPGPWLALGELGDAGLSAAAWLLLYYLWERRFGGELRDGLTFWTAVGGALARLLACAASARGLLRSEDTQLWGLLRLLPLCFLAAAVTAVWRSVRLSRLRYLWLLLIAVLALRLLTAALDSQIDPLLLRLPLIGVHAAIDCCLAAARKK